MACTSPASIVRSIPFRIGLPSTVACRFLISSMLRSDPRNTCRFELTDAAFQRDADQLLRLDGELHGELLHDLAAEAVHHQGDGVLLRQAALAAVEQLVLAGARGGRLVLDDRSEERRVGTECVSTCTLRWSSRN